MSHSLRFAVVALWSLATACLCRADEAAKPAAAQAAVIVAPAATVCQRPGITGSGWGAVYDFTDHLTTVRRAVCIYPNHPDDWGKTLGTGASFSADGGRTWTPGADNWPLPGMLDMWLDTLPDGTLLAFGIRRVPDPKTALQPDAASAANDQYVLGVSRDQGRTWRTESAVIHCPSSIGMIARPLPHIFPDAGGALFMPGYSWSKAGRRALLLRSDDQGRNWHVAATIATAQAMGACGAPLTMPWLETTVARTADGTWLAVVRTGSTSQSPLVMSRSADRGQTWSPVEKVLAGRAGKTVPGKMPGLCLLSNGVLVLLTAHTKNHCRVYAALDGTGRQWSEGFALTSQSGGNTSMIATGPDTLLVFTPASERIYAWQVTVRAATPDDSPSRVSAPARVAVASSGPAVNVSWTAPAGAEVDHYLVTPVLIKPAQAQSETDVYRYAAIATRDATPRIDLGRVLSLGGTYRFAVAAVDRQGRRSAAAASADVVVGAAYLGK